MRSLLIIINKQTNHKAFLFINVFKRAYLCRQLILRINKLSLIFNICQALAEGLGLYKEHCTDLFLIDA